MVVVLKPLAPLDAIDAFRARQGELAESFSYLDFWQEDHATMFTVAKSAGFDVLRDISDAFEQHLKDGKTAASFGRQLRPVLEAKGWWGRKVVEDPQSGEMVPAQLGSARRLQTIFDANMRVSYAAGHWTNFERNRKARPYLRYVALLDDRTRPAHRARHNLVLPIDHPYWDLWAPPCGWNCRCTLQSLSQRDIDRLRAEGEDLRFEPPDDTFRNFLNKRTGEVSRVPDGIDPGWAYNPGRAGYEAKVNQALADKIAGAPREFVAAAVDERLKSTAFERFYGNPQGSMPVLALPTEFAAIDPDARVAFMSSGVMRRQKTSQPTLTFEDYRAIGSMSDATMIVQQGDRTVVLERLSSGTWRVLSLEVEKGRRVSHVVAYSLADDSAIDAFLATDGVSIVTDRR